MIGRLAHLLFSLFTRAVERMPLERAFTLGSFLGRCAHAVAIPYRKLAADNIRIAFGDEWSAAEIRACAARHFELLGANLLSGLRQSRLRPDEIDAAVQPVGIEKIERAFNAGRGVVLVIGHIGNWELFAHLGHLLPGRTLSTIYQPLGNARIDRGVRERRGRKGVLPFSRREGFVKATRLLRENGLVAVLADQHAGDGGVWTPFFGRLASTSPLAATLALRTGATLVPAAIYTVGAGKWRLEIFDPILPTGGLGSLTARLNQTLEAMIRKSPPDWFWVHRRWKTPSPHFLLASAHRGITLPDRTGPADLKPFRIVVRSPNWLGDAVMSVPAVAAIRRGRPDARVTVLTPEKLEALWREVAASGAIDDVIPFAPDAGVAAVARLLKRAEQGPFDAAILLPNSLRSALEARLAGIPRRAGYRGHRRRWLLDQVIEPSSAAGPRPHHARLYMELARHCGAEPGEVAFPTRPTPAPHTAAAEPELRLALCPGAEYGPAKRWPADRFAQVARAVAERHACRWILLGTAADQAAADTVAKALAGNGEGAPPLPCENLAGKTSLTELISELRRCRLLLTNDTGTMHLAALLGLPTVSIFGSTEPALTAPLGPGHRIVRRHVECSPCFLRECPIDFRCMREVAPETVAAAVEAALDTDPPAAT